ncbi:MAG: hypothetical protein ABFS45_05105 [Pseudomonadota bacterium]
MDIFKDLLMNNRSELVDTLSEAGFSAEQAQEFIPEAAQGVQQVLSGGGGDLLSLLGGGDSEGIVSALLEKVDIAGIASRLGLDESMVNTGLETLLPRALEIMNEQGSGLSSLLGGEGGILGGIAKLGSKFFK